MKFFVVFCSIIAVVYAGVGQLSPSEEAEALNLFARACAGGQDVADLGHYSVYCKRAHGDLQETLNHQVNVPGSQGQGQVVFVQPPPVRYHHNIHVSGGNSQAGQTKIYVLPQKADHQISTQVNPGSQIAAKPTVFFLKSGGSGSSRITSNGGGYNAPQPQIETSAQYTPQQGYNF